MLQTTLKFLLYLLGLAAVLIGASIFLFGADRTANISATIVGFLVGGFAPVKGLDVANVDSELRFYAVFWIAYGVVLLSTATDLARHGSRVPLLLSLFFLGGIGRLISYFSAGIPHPLFVTLMVVELAVPPILYFLWLGTERNKSS